MFRDPKFRIDTSTGDTVILMYLRYSRSKFLKLLINDVVSDLLWVVESQNYLPILCCNFKYSVKLSSFEGINEISITKMNRV